MSKLKIKDFEGLNVSPFANKVAEVKDIDFLTELEKWEKENENRKGALSAINERQGELYEQAEKENFKNLIAKEEDVETLKSMLEEARGEEDGDKEKLIINRLAELQKTPETDTPGAPPTPPAPDDKGTPGEDYSNGPKGDDLEDETEEIEKKEFTAVDFVKMHRLEIDRILQFAQGHFRISEDIDSSLFMGKAWLGKLLNILGEEDPYEVGKIKNPKDVPATAEKNEGTDFIVARKNFGLKNTLDAVQELRKDLSSVISNLGHIDTESRDASICRTQAWVHLVEARFKLGQELSKLRG